MSSIDNTATATPETPYKPPIKPLTRKQSAFIRHLVDNPKASATQAVIATYGKPDKPVTYETARNIASDNLAKPNILAELSKYSNNAELTVIEVMNYSKELGKSGSTAGASYASTALQSANSILDRLHGKATQRTEVKSQAVTLHIDLTSSL